MARRVAAHLDFPTGSAAIAVTVTVPLPQNMSRNGRPEPEVIMNVRFQPYTLMFTHLTCLQYADGFAYSKGKMEEAFRPGGILEKPPTKPAKDPNAPPIKREDIDLIVRCTYLVA